MTIPNQPDEKEQYWRSLLREQPGSGMTVKAFCQQRGVSVPSFYAWRRKIGQRDLPKDQQLDHQQDRLVPVELVDLTAGNRPDVASRIEIVTPGGFTIRVDHRFVDSGLGRLLEAITALEADARSC